MRCFQLQFVNDLFFLHCVETTFIGNYGKLNGAPYGESYQLPEGVEPISIGLLSIVKQSNRDIFMYTQDACMTCKRWPVDKCLVTCLILFFGQIPLSFQIGNKRPPALRQICYLLFYSRFPESELPAAEFHFWEAI